MTDLYVKVLCRGYTAVDHNAFVSVSTLGKFLEASTSGWSEDTQCVYDIVREIERPTA